MDPWVGAMQRRDRVKHASPRPADGYFASNSRLFVPPGPIRAYTGPPQPGHRPT